MHTVLIIDDEPAILSFLQHLLQDAGYHTVTANNGHEGLAHLQSRPVDVVLCDIMMPGLSGLDVEQAIHSHPGHTDIPVILMSALVHPLAPQANTLFVVKPFDPDKLLQTLEHALKLPPGRAAAPGHARKPTILLVDDAALNLVLLTKMLMPAGYNVNTASDGKQALIMAEQIRPDLILMDLMMPVMDGWAATQHLKATAHLAHIPVIAVTAVSDQNPLDRALKAGCSAYLLKPVTYAGLISMVQKYTPTTTKHVAG